MKKLINTIKSLAGKVIRTPALTGIKIDDPYKLQVLHVQEEQNSRTSLRLASKPRISYKE